MVQQQRQLSWSPVRALPKPFWIVTRSQLRGGNLLLILKQHVALLTGKILIIIEIFFFLFTAMYSVLGRQNNQIITNVSVLLAVIEHL